MNNVSVVKSIEDTAIVKAAPVPMATQKKTRSTRTAKCGACDEPFANTDGWVQCAACQDYLHRRCSGLSDLVFEAMTEVAKQPKTKKGNVLYNCEMCDETVTDLLSNL